jgi:hypothetical protein
MITLTPYKTNQPIASCYFIQALQSNSLAHAYVLKGQDMDEMYGMVLDLAKIMNCQHAIEVGAACGDCPNCHWIAENSHPAVMTLSRLTYLVSDQGKDLSEEDLHKLAKKNTQQTQIKAEQIQRLLSQLGLSTEYCRIIIFTDAEEMPAGSGTSHILPPAEWRAIPGNEEKCFCLRPLERRLFNAASANRFLKTLEEPPPKTLFFFLTDSEENLLETIVSRCQVIPFVHQPSPEKMSFPSNYQPFFQHLMTQFHQTSDLYALVPVFEEFFFQQEGLSPIQALHMFQGYLHSEFLKQTVTQQHFWEYRRLQEKIESCKKLLQAKTNTEQTLNHLFWHLTQPAKAAFP